MEDLATWTLATALFLISVIETPGLVVNWHLVPKQALVLIFGVIALAIMIFPWTTTPPRINLGPAQTLALGWGVWCVVSCSWSVNPWFSFRTAFMQLSLVLLFILGSSYALDWFILCVSGALGLLINATLSLYQHFHGDPWIPYKKSRCGFGTFGNRNWYGSYAVGAIAFPIWLGLNSHPAWFYLVALTLITLILARSKASLLSLTLGLAAIPFFLSKSLRNRFHTLRYRYHYWRAGVWLVKERPFLGFGMRQYRREVYRANAAIDELTKGKFLDPESYGNPKPREAHNDYIGFAVDCGLIGLALFVGAFTYTLIQAQSFWLAFGIVGILLNALVFYPLRTPGTATVFWVLLAMVSAGPATSYSIPTLTSMILFLVLGVPILISTHRLFVSSYHANRAYKTGNAEFMNKALALDRNNSCHLMAVLPTMMQQDLIAASHCLHRMIEHFDGDTIPWAIWEEYARCRMNLGSIFEARRCYEQSLKSMPYYKPALKGIQKCDQIIKGGKVEINFKQQPQPQQGRQYGQRLQKHSR